MKKHILTIIGCAVLATWVLAEVVQVKNTAEGYRIGTTSTQKIGFFGATPVVKQTGVTVADGGAQILSNQLASAAAQTQVVKAGATQVALTLNSATLTYVASIDNGTGMMASVSVVTNASVNTVWGFATTTPQVVITNSIAAASVATNQIVGTVATSALSTNVVTALRNLGLAGD
jgi:hypothetical protein